MVTLCMPSIRPFLVYAKPVRVDRPLQVYFKRDLVLTGSHNLFSLIMNNKYYKPRKDFIKLSHKQSLVSSINSLVTSRFHDVYQFADLDHKGILRWKGLWVMTFFGKLILG